MSTCADFAVPSITNGPSFDWPGLDLDVVMDGQRDAHVERWDQFVASAGRLIPELNESSEFAKAASAVTTALFNARLAHPSTSVPDYLGLSAKSQAFATRLIVTSTADSDVHDAATSIYGTDANAAALVQALNQVFTNYSLKSERYVDPEEGWRKTVLLVQTGIDDLDKRLALEDQFYSIVDSKIQLRNALQQIIVSFQ